MKESNVQCVGIIMDGSRRWARKKGLPVLEGHQHGYEKFKEVVEFPDLLSSVQFNFETL